MSGPPNGDGTSPFLNIPPSAWVASNALAFAVEDRFPVSAGHTLVITRRVVATWFDASDDERHAVLALVDEVKRRLDEVHQPDGYNVGFNAGAAAGQTVMHLHVHVIPRYRGDMDDPRGGVRHVIPSKGNYLRDVRDVRPQTARPSPLATGGTNDPFARHILPLFATAADIAIVAAFIQDSGLSRIQDDLHAAVRRGARVRIVTGDYLDITQASALERLVDWQESGARGDSSDLETTERPGSIETRVIEVATLPGLTRAFHPKSWSFESSRYGIAFVGSSNLSRSALDTGVEWNLRVDRERDTEAYARVRGAFESLWSAARTLDEAWVERYAQRTREAPHALPTGEIVADPVEPPPEPHAVQVEALARLRDGRTNHGWRSALVVLATGLGKTWLAAFDYRQLHEETGVRPRLLFLAHRQELLRQAADTYRRLLRARDVRARFGWFVGEGGDLSADLVFASVAKLARQEHLAKLAGQRFDYVVVDEVHHAAATSYRSILRSLEPTFLLGLTATPDRADAADILGLFDDRLAYAADIGRGVELDRLVPFHYFGVKDEIEYANIPWRNKRFDPAALAEAAQTEARMETLWRAWHEHPGRKTLIFCCGIAHAEFVRTWLSARGVRTAAVYSAEGTDDREGAIQALARGDLDAVCSVDVFNEGVDLPSVDRVVMLRPTESGVLFLQQLGRGLRAAPGKSSVTVIDFVGNHRVFLERLRTLLSLGGRAAPGVRGVLESGSDAPIELASGCSVQLELEAKELLSRMFRVGGADEVERVYRELRVERGLRPKAGELQRMGYLPSRLRARHQSWFGFVRSEQDLSDDEAAALDEAGAFLAELEITEMTKCFKMVTLEVLLEADAIHEGLSLLEIARRSYSILRRSPELYADVPDTERVDTLTPAAEPRWLAYWRRNPIEAWTSAGKDRRAWFRIEGDRLIPTFKVGAAAVAALPVLVAELTDYRIAQYRARKRFGDVTADGFVCRVLSNQRDPILKLPSDRAKLPDGEVEVWIGSSVWQFRFAKEFCNVARPAGTQRNQLPDLVRRWFGPSAGQPGTGFEVRFRASPDGLWAEPVHSPVVELEARRGVVAYPDLRAAAGHLANAQEAGELHPELVMLPTENAGDELFAVRVCGTSMDGGKVPMRDGDWALMTLARRAPASTLENRVVLVQVQAEGTGSQYQLKRLRRRAGGWLLASDNPDGPSFDASEDMQVIARLERTISPESLAPTPGTVLSETELAPAFGLDELLPRSGRQGGHLFVFIDRAGLLKEPDRVARGAEERRPGETAFVLARREDGAYAFLGVGRWLDDEACWAIPEADYATWRQWGAGRATSRRLPPGALARAQVVVDALVALPEERRWIAHAEGRRARVLGAAPRGGLRVDGGDGGFKERTVSLVDLAWVILAADDARAHGGLLDEARVNRLRYLDGTPKGATRWIDTGWALAAWEAGKGLTQQATASPGAARAIRSDDGTPLDATFRVEPVGDTLSIVLESRGGTQGTGTARNTHYDRGLQLVLERLAAAGLSLADAVVESRDTARLSHEQRRLELPQPYPVRIDDLAILKRAIGAAQARVGRQPGAKGSGNRTRRLRLFVVTPMGAETLAQALAGSTPSA